MALKAGYQGVKKALLDAVKNLSGALVIKSLGDGFNLTNAGKLNMTAATASKMGGFKVGENLEMSNGVLSAKGGGFDYSTTNMVNTGQKWIDGKDIYCKTFTGVTVPKTAYTTNLDLGAEIDTFIKVEYGEATGGADLVNNLIAYAKIVKTAGSNTIFYPTNYIAALTNVTLTVFFTLAESEG